MQSTIEPTGRTGWRKRHLRRAGVVIGTAVLLVLGLLATAQARTTVERGEWKEGLFYGNDDLLLFAGGTVQEFCAGDEPVHDATYRYPDGGGFVMTVQPTTVRPLYLYETTQTDSDGEPVTIVDAPQFTAAVCAGSIQPEPFAAGEGRMKLRLDVTSGLPHIVNSSWGTVTSDDGTIWNVRGRADLMIGADGMPTEDPSVFQSLQLVRTGR
jgi:hypothetical protein